jgi:uncharacterized protein
MYNRIIKTQIQEALFKNKLIILYGPRQVGKTTLIKEILKDYPDSEYLTGDDVVVRTRLSKNDLGDLIASFKNLKLLVIDEAQKILNIGNTLKLLVDNIPSLQVIATGSSSFELANQIREPLTGRYFQFFLYPLSFTEILNQQTSLFLYKGVIEKQLIYGSYPDIYDLDNKEAVNRLNLLAGDYLYRDILNLQEVKSPTILTKLTSALAFQIGSEVSKNELAGLLNTTKETVARYIDLLKKAFIIFELSSFSRNLRNEISKNSKYYFYDLGLRNSLIQNFNPIELRNDVGGLFENFCILERLKVNTYNQNHPNYYFWRTYDQQEIDFIEEEGGLLKCFEFKYNSKKTGKLPIIFQKTYLNSTFKVINLENFREFIGE